MTTNINTRSDGLRVHQNAVIIANVVELVCACVKNSAQSETGTALGDDSFNKGVLGSIVANHIQEKFLQP